MLGVAVLDLLNGHYQHNHSQQFVAKSKRASLMDCFNLHSSFFY